MLPAGPQKELDIWPVFAVLAELLISSGAASTIHMLLIGPDVPLGMHDRTQLLGECIVLPSNGCG